MKALRVLLVFLAGMVVQSSAWVQAAEQVAVDVVLATVNGTPVLSSQFLEAAGKKKPAVGTELSLEEHQEVLQHLIEEEALYQEALKKGYDKDPKVKKVMVNTLLRDEVYDQVHNSDFTDEVLQAYFVAHEDEFVVPEKRQIKRVLLKVTEERDEEDTRAEIDRIYSELLAGGDFGDIAARFSEDPYRRRGGDIGFIAREGKPGLDQAIVEKAWSIPEDHISAPFRTEEGWNIIVVAAHRDEVKRTFQQMKGSVLRKVKNEKLKQLYDAYTAKLLAAAKVNIDRKALKELVVPPYQATPGMLGAEAIEPAEPDESE